MTTLAVSEIFGPTLQGEGASLGRPCLFLRLGGCNLACSWCDTPYTWDWKRYNVREEVSTWDIDGVVARLRLLKPANWGAPMLVVSGGEPMLQQRALAECLELLVAQALQWDVEIETAGTLAPLPALDVWVDRYTVSLKLTHSGNPFDKRRKPAAIVALNETGKATWKFVAARVADLHEVDDLVAEYGLRGRIYIMPEGITHRAITQHARALAPEVIARGWSLTPRFHVDLWGTKRGV